MQLLIYRDDQNHPTVSGNKLHKLAPNLRLAKQLGCETIVSFGGAYSNHLHALAWACKDQGIASVGLIRGELHQQLTPTLEDCQIWGMRLIPVQRKTYRDLQETLRAQSGPCLAQKLLPKSIAQLPANTLVIPEGGSNILAIESLAEAYQPIFAQAQYHDVSHVACATGTGATLAGLHKAAPKNVSVIGVQAVAEGRATIERIHGWLNTDSPCLESSNPELSNLSIVPGHLGGFAKMPVELLEFISQFELQHNIPLDPIYNGKVAFKLSQMDKEGFFKDKDKVLMIHTGGLQGVRRA